jgi:hypothetical protein
VPDAADGDGSLRRVRRAHCKVQPASEAAAHMFVYVRVCPGARCSLKAPLAATLRLSCRLSSLTLIRAGRRVDGGPPARPDQPHPRHPLQAHRNHGNRRACRPCRDSGAWAHASVPLSLSLSLSLSFSRSLAAPYISPNPHAQSQDGSGFRLVVALAEAHRPRMWVEEDAHGHAACMLTFYPQFDASPGRPETVLMLDCSCSMADGLTDACRAAAALVALLPEDTPLNVVLFGDTFVELFPVAQPATQEAKRKAFAFIASAKPVWGATELWRPLRTLQLLAPPPTAPLRAVMLFSDGHVRNANAAIRMASALQGTRLFVFGVGSAVDKHTLRALARASGGAAEMLDPARKSKWRAQTQAQIDRSQQPGVSDVQVRSAFVCECVLCVRLYVCVCVCVSICVVVVSRAKCSTLKNSPSRPLTPPPGAMAAV